MRRLLPPNIVITGSWRSGTTLLYLLFPHAFKDVVISGQESDALETLLPAEYKWRISKRPNDIHRIREIGRLLNPYVIYMLRDPRDCIVSWRGERNCYYLSFNEWLRNLLFAESEKLGKLLIVRFEDLVQCPDLVQVNLIECIEGLEQKKSFGGCYRLIVQDSPIIHQLARSDGRTIRAMDLSVIGVWQKDRKRVLQQLAEYPEMQAVLEKYGYEENDTWAQL